MPQTSHNLGHAKHHQAFGKTNRNPTNNLLLSRELNKEADERAKKKQQSGKWHSSITDLFKTKRK